MKVRCSAWLVALLLPAACASTAGGKVHSQVDAMRQEQSSDKLFERGKAFANVGDYTRAEQYLSGALDAGADERQVMPVLLRVCLEDRRYRVAREYAQDYLRRHPREGSMRYVLCTIESALDDKEAARACLRRVLEEQPNHAEAHFALATLLRDDGGDRLAADGHFRDYLRLKPDGTHAEEATASLLKTVPPPASTGTAPAPAR